MSSRTHIQIISVRSLGQIKKKNTPVHENILQQLESRNFASSKFYVKRF